MQWLELVLLIPVVKSNANQHIQLAHDVSYEDAINIIHDTMGCASVTKKPDLMYRLSSSTAKSNPISLVTDGDWEGCKDDVISAQKKKKGETISISVIVSETVSS